MSKLKLGQRVDRVREDLGVTRTALADALGLDRSTVTKWGTGHSSPRDLDAVADALGVAPSRFFEEPKQPRVQRTRRAAA